MKKLSYLMITALILVNSSFAQDADLKFLSPRLNSIIGVFQKYSPELVKLGELNVAYCGSYGAAFSLNKVNPETFKKDFIVILDAPANFIDYAALDLSEDLEAQLSSDVTNYVLKNRDALKMGGAYHLQRGAGDVLISYVYSSSTNVIMDTLTGEYLSFGGIRWQDDCD